MIGLEMIELEMIGLEMIGSYRKQGIYNQTKQSNLVIKVFKN